MALPSSGTIKMSQINTELGRSSNAQISLDSAENGSYATINTNSASRPSAGNPARLSEWLGYNHTASGGGGSYDYYYAEEYVCNGSFACSYNGTVLVRVAAGFSPNSSRYYASLVGNAYKITGGIQSAGTAVILNTDNYSTSCTAIACVFD